MTDPTVQSLAEGERRALYEWQLEHREPCDDCQWSVEHIRTYGSAEHLCTRTTLDPCPRHGGMP